MPSRGFNVWGNPLIWRMMAFAGIRHWSFFCKSRNRNRFALVNAFLISCLKNQTPQDLAEITGRKIK